MPTTVKRVTVGRETPSAADVLDYAAALIRTFGWNKIKEGAVVAKSSETAGFTLHDAIGESCTRLSRAVAGSSEGTKDWTVKNFDGVEENLRAKATQAVEDAINESGFKSAPGAAGTLDQRYNDKAKNVDQVLAILEKAKAGAGE